MTQTIWNSTDIVDQSGRVVIVTGGNSGLGLETATVLAAKNAAVILAVRTPGKGEAAKHQIKEQFPGAVISVMELDLADLASVKAFAAKFRCSFSRLDLLINNGGVMVPPYARTVDGFELQMGTNHFGHFALTGRLMDLLSSTPESRIVSVSSMAHKMGNINFDDLHWEKRRYKKWNAYGDSKIANLYFISALQKRLERINSHIISAAAHPGYTATNLQQHSGFSLALNPFFAQAVSMGALPILYAATAKDVRGADFYGPSGFMEIRGYPKKVAPNRRAKDPEIAEKLWKISEELTRVSFLQ